MLALLAGMGFGNALDNPGFESWLNDSTPNVWRVEQRSRTSVLVEHDTVRSGAGACRLTRLVAGIGDNKGVLQRIPVIAGAAGVVSARCLDNSPDILLGIVISWRSQDSTYISSTTPVYSSDNPGWQLVADTISVPDRAAFADVILRTYGTAGATPGNRVIVDDADYSGANTAPDTVRLWFVQDSLAMRLIGFFDGAVSSIDYCCYNSSRFEVDSALMRAHERGLRVRVITDNTRMDDPWVAQLRDAGVVVWSDSLSSNSASYMHDKFVVRDLEDADTSNDMTWCASYNPNNGETNADYGMEVPSTPLARAYRAEFEQMWGCSGDIPDSAHARFHGSKTDVLSDHEFAINGHRARLYFSPQNRVVDTVTATAALCQQELAFAVNSFTYDNLGEAMIGLAGNGTRVFGVFDNANAGDSASEFFRLRDQHLPVLIDSVPFGDGTLHEKIMVIDSSVAVTGSANWSNNANYANDENTLIIEDPTLAHRFLAEILRRYAEAGGTYPPGIAETAAAPFKPRRESQHSPVRTTAEILPGTTLYDACGRRHRAAGLETGIYFCVTNRHVLPVVIIH
jgi:hypothetical protein